MDTSLASAGDKRRAESDPGGSEDDRLTVQPLGAGQEVGRSCHIVRFKGRTIMLDCGIHPGKHGLEGLPFTDEVNAAAIDLILITHFHLDHCAALPWFLRHSTFKGDVYMTHATKAIYRWILADYVRVTNIGAEQKLYDEADIKDSMDRIKCIDFHEEKIVNGIRFTPYNAGHVLGAAMFMIEIAGVKVLYTGDFSREEDRHLMAAEVPQNAPDILITESTYGIQEHEPRGVREKRFTDEVHAIVARNGKCLVPVFALGRAQELLLILDEYWAAHPRLHGIPIYYASAMAQKCMAIYQTYVNVMNTRIQDAVRFSNPFQFRHISTLPSLARFDDRGPSVVLASPGMLQNGQSRELLEKWAPDASNGVIIAGYSVDGTLAKDIMKEPVDIPTLAGGRIPRRLSVATVSFSAHVDYPQNRAFIMALNPPKIVLVHGEASQMNAFKTHIVRDYEDNRAKDTESRSETPRVFTPDNVEIVEFFFRGEKIAKIMGKAASETPRDGLSTSGLLIKRGFDFHVVIPEDLQDYFADLSTSAVKQRQMLAFPFSFGLLTHYLTQMHGAVVHPTTAEDGCPALVVMEKVTVVHMADTRAVVVEWLASAEADMWADAVVGLILQIESRPESIRLSQQELTTSPMPTEEAMGDVYFAKVQGHLQRMYGCCVKGERAGTLEVTVDGATAVLDVPTLLVDCPTNAALKDAVHKVAARVRGTLLPHAPMPAQGLAGSGIAVAVKA